MSHVYLLEGHEHSLLHNKNIDLVRGTSNYPAGYITLLGRVKKVVVENTYS